MTDLLTKWNSLNLLQKILIIAALPVVLVLLVSPLGRSVLAYLEERTRAKVDQKSAELDAQINQQEADANRAEGSLQETEEEQSNAIQNAKNDNPQEAVDFWNSRPNPTDKQ